VCRCICQDIHERLDAGHLVSVGGRNRGPGELTSSEQLPRVRISERVKGSELVGFRVVNCGKY